MNLLVVAVAGSRKTQSIVDACASGVAKRRLVISFTTNAQADVAARLREACSPADVPVVLGWFTFLLQDWVRPFVPNKYPGRRLKGFNYEGLPRTNSRNVVVASGEERYFDSDSRAYGRFLSKLAFDVSGASAGQVIYRLEQMYDEIYIDEVQDLTGYDLDILELLLRSAIRINMVGDLRQSLFSTNYSDPRNRKYKGLGMLAWFKEMEVQRLLELKNEVTTWRSNQAIATFSDNIFDSSYGFLPTESHQTEVSGHDGLFVVAPEGVSDYLATYAPNILRASKATPIPLGLNATNFGSSKGVTHDRVLIYPTGTIAKFLTSGVPLAEKAAFGLYVAVTRAKYSVAFVHPKPTATGLVEWKST
ncbi:UvrD-helicase domain-containing protein [Clavibacter michiganensis]|uniref:UvrD-helicase domain-containing protein n=1 Tax=Clavibacter michiganensis TaxID=28447 RepID=UPI00126A6418|nr:UvrD-helicase domain-containing protein [Clavibacter michiganensis]